MVHNHHDHGHGGAGHAHPDADAHAHGSPPPTPDADDPGPRLLKRADGRVAFSSSKVKVARARNPQPQASFGFVGTPVRLSHDGRTFPEGALAVAIDRRALGPVARETLRVFRWDERERAYELVTRSGLGQSGDYVWAYVSEPGLYSVVGLNTDPLVSRTLGLLQFFEGWLGVEEVGPILRDSICKLILCSNELGAAANDPRLARLLLEGNAAAGLPLPPGPWPGPTPDGKDICDRCLALPLPRPGHAHRPKPVPWIPELQIWPHHCWSTPSAVGRWEVLPIEADGVLAVHAALLRTNKVVYFGGSENVQSQHDAGQIDNTRVWDVASGAVQQVGSPPNHDLFCCGQALMGDGRVLAAGGTQHWAGVPVAGDPHGHAAFGHFRGTRSAALFNPGVSGGGNPWTVASPMGFERGTNQGGGRWYPTLTTLPNGRVLALSGHPEDTDTRHNNVMVETFGAAPAPQGSWLDRGDQALVPEGYPRVHVLPNGRVFVVYLIDGNSWTWTPSTGNWALAHAAGAGPGPEYAGYGTSSVLLPLLPANGHRARVLVTNAPQPRVIDLGASSPAWQNAGARTLSGSPWRYHATAVLLPDGSTLVVGGLRDYTDNATAVHAVERYDSTTGSWSTLASASVPRVYHSVALLLPDATVWTAGSDYGGGNHDMRFEIFYPPYLFWGPRPTIAAAPATIGAGGTFQITVPRAHKMQSVALMRCGSSTHAFNPDQRHVGIEIMSRTGNRLTLGEPPSSNVAPPGHYLLFVVDDRGIPSVGRYVRVT